MPPRRWQRQVLSEIESALIRSPVRLSVDVPARRAGVARRRLRWIAAQLTPHHFVLETVDPTRRRATRRFSVAHFALQPPT